MKDPFQAAFEDQEVSPPHSPTPPPSSSNYHQTPADDDDDDDDLIDDRQLAVETDRRQSNAGGVRAKDNNNDDEEEDDENMADAEYGKFSNANPGDPDKMARMQLIGIKCLSHRETLSKFSEEHMSRYESFRRSNFQKANMRKLLASIIGSQKISNPMVIVVNGITKMFVGDLVETVRNNVKRAYYYAKTCKLQCEIEDLIILALGRMVMKERNDNGPLRPCHIREAYRRLKLEGKIPKRSVPRLFH